jgi:hypothetical protein
VLLAWREIFSSGVGDGMAKYAREDVAISMVALFCPEFSLGCFVVLVVVFVDLVVDGGGGG